MATRFTTEKAPGMAVTLSRAGVYIELEGDMIKVSSDQPDDVEQVVLAQFHGFDDSIAWEDVQSADLHNQYNTTIPD